MNAPTVTAGGPYTAPEGSSVTLFATGSDLDGDSLTYSWDVNGDGVFGDATGQNPTLSAAQLVAFGLGDGPDSSSIRVRASDGVFTTTSAATTLTITNLAPTPTYAPLTTAEDMVLTIYAADLVTDISAYDVSAGFRVNQITDVVNGTVSFAPNGTSLVFTPDSNFFGIASFTHRILDKDGGFTIATAYIEVTPQDDAPTVSAGGPYTITEGDSLTLAAIGFDPDGDTLTYEWDIDGDGQYDDATGANPTLTWSQLEALGLGDGPVMRNISVEVSDGVGTTTDATTLVVTNAPPVPTNVTLTVAEDGVLFISASTLARDAGYADTAAGFRFVFADSGNTYAAGATAMTFRPDANFYGLASFTYTISDKDGGLLSGTATIEVTPEDDALEVSTSPGTTEATEQTAIVIDAGLTLVDVDDEALTYAEVYICSCVESPGDTLLFQDTDKITGEWDAATRTLKLNAVTTATAAEFQAALRSVQFIADSNAPIAGERTLGFAMYDGSGMGYVANKTVNVTAVNDNPHDIALSATKAKEFAKAGAVVGTLLASDDDSNSFTYTLTNDAGGRFAINGNKIVVANGIALDYEQARGHVVSVRVSDGAGGTRIESFTIGVLNVDPEVVTGNNAMNVILGGARADRLSGLGGNDRLVGNFGNDTLDGGIGMDTLIGGADNDILIGNAGADTMTGGLGSDTFKFLNKTHSFGASTDIITDFDDGGSGDRIDVSALFPRTMSYIHTGAFTAWGQVRVVDVAGPDVLVEVNTGGSLAADFTIRLKTTAIGAMGADDFVL